MIVGEDFSFTVESFAITLDIFDKRWQKKEGSINLGIAQLVEDSLFGFGEWIDAHIEANKEIQIDCLVIVEKIQRTSIGMGSIDHVGKLVVFRLQLLK